MLLFSFVITAGRDESVEARALPPRAHFGSPPKINGFILYVNCHFWHLIIVAARQRLQAILETPPSAEQDPPTDSSQSIKSEGETSSEQVRTSIAVSQIDGLDDPEKVA